MAYLGNLNLCTSDHRTSKGGTCVNCQQVIHWGIISRNGHTEKVDVFVDSIAGNCGEAELINELATNVNDFALQSTALQSLGASSLEVLCNYLVIKFPIASRGAGMKSVPSWQTSATA